MFSCVCVWYASRYVCMFLCGGICVGACIHMCTGVCSPKVDITYLPWSCFSLFIEAGPFTAPRTLGLAGPGSQLALEIPCLCFLSAGIRDGCHVCLAVLGLHMDALSTQLFHGFQESELWFLACMINTLSTDHLPSPRTLVLIVVSKFVQFTFNIECLTCF